MKNYLHFVFFSQSFELGHILPLVHQRPLAADFIIGHIDKGPDINTCIIEHFVIGPVQHQHGIVTQQHPQFGIPAQQIASSAQGV